jgi:L-lactate dehydrogenase complex protein LldG
MNSIARDRILQRLRSSQEAGGLEATATACLPIQSYSQADRIEQLKSRMEAVRTEVHVTSEADWLNKLQSIVAEKKIQSLLFAPDTPIGKQLRQEAESHGDEAPQLIPYDKEVEAFKEALFAIDAGITSTFGGIAETGAIILWPDQHEPRLMSLVPPIHIAVLEADKIYNSFCEVIQKENWPQQMPTNALLISGPSKTADIELTLAFGVHGPKELVVVIIE